MGIVKRDLEGFFLYLCNNRNVSREKAAYYMFWAGVYLSLAEAFLNDHRLSARVSVRDAFALHVAAQFQEWQVKQAEYAVLQYLIYTGQAPGPRKTGREERYRLLAKKRWIPERKKLRTALRVRNRSYSTEKSYVYWLRRFAEFLGYKNSNEIREEDLRLFLEHLAVHDRISAATQTQAFNALLFFYRYVLEIETPNIRNVVRSKYKIHIPVVLTRLEVQMVLDKLRGRYRLMTSLIYGGGLRLRECLNLRIKDIDFGRRSITVHAGKGDKDRETLLPEDLLVPMRRQFERARLLYDEDRRENRPGVSLPNALERKYPGAGCDWSWFWVFPSPKLSVDPVESVVRRHHIYSSSLQKAFHKAVRQAGISKAASVHTLRHSFATHLVEGGYDIRTIQELLGHNSLQTTMIYTHVAKKNKLGVESPFDTLRSLG